MSQRNTRRAGKSRQDYEGASSRWLASLMDEVGALTRPATAGARIRLQRWMRRVASGSNVDIRSALFGEERNGAHVNRPREDIVRGFDKMYSQAEAIRKAYPRVCVLLDAIEMDARKNIGPMSVCLPYSQDGPEKVRAVFSDKKPLPIMNRRAVEYALDQAGSVLQADSISPVSITQAIMGTPNRSAADSDGMDTTTNSGEPFWLNTWMPTESMKPGPKRDEVVAAAKYYLDASKRMVSFLSQPKKLSELPYWVATVGQRLVQKGPKPFSPKSKRIIEAYGKVEAITGKTYVQPITDKLRDATFRGFNVMCAWHDLPTVDKAMQGMLQAADSAGRIVLSGDAANFDQTLPPWFLESVAEATIVRWVRPGAKDFVRNHVKMMIYRTRLITPQGVTPDVPSSMKSGSVLTSLLGSLANLVLQLYGEGLGLYKIEKVAVLGDDFVLDGPGVSPEATNTTFSHFGMEAHPDKQFYERGALQYLKRLHVLGLPGGIASTYRVLGSILSLERMSTGRAGTGKYSYIMQALSKLQNATFNPYFELLVAYVMSGDKYRLGKDLSAEELAARSGQLGTNLLAEERRKPWRNIGKGMTFDRWSVNGVIRGEKLPPLGKERFQRVYGISVN